PQAARQAAHEAWPTSCRDRRFRTFRAQARPWRIANQWPLRAHFPSRMWCSAPLLYAVLAGRSRRRPGADPLLGPAHDAERLAQLGARNRRQLIGIDQVVGRRARLHLGGVVLEPDAVDDDERLVQRVSGGAVELSDA